MSAPKYIEQPFRNKNFLKPREVFIFSVAFIVLFLVIGFAGYKYKGFPARFNENLYLETIKPSPMRSECHTGGVDYLKPEESCTYYKDNVTWATLGDSHVVEMAYALAKRLEPKDQGVLHLSFSGCVPAISMDIKLTGCRQWLVEALDLLENREDIQNVVVGFRDNTFLYGDQVKTYPEAPNIYPLDKFNNDYVAQQVLDLRAVYWQDYQLLINRLLDAGKNVYILYPIPELPMHISKLTIPFSIFGDEPLYDLNKVTTHEYYLKRNKTIIGELDKLTGAENVQAIKPYDLLCSRGYCPAIYQDKALYFDDDHLSIIGASTLLSKSTIID